MTATDELHRLLGELRKLACDINEEEIRSHSVITLNQGRYNRQFRLDMNHDWLNAWHAELERILRAVEDTLGRGTCHLKEIDKDCDTASEYMLEREWCFDAVYRCSCGCRFGHISHDRPHFCPNCGAKVVTDGADE